MNNFFKIVSLSFIVSACGSQLVEFKEDAGPVGVAFDAGTGDSQVDALVGETLVVDSGTDAADPDDVLIGCGVPTH